MPKTQFISLTATDEDFAILQEICKRYGDASRSSVLRRLIREEAQRCHIRVPHAQTAAPENA